MRQAANQIEDLLRRLPGAALPVLLALLVLIAVLPSFTTLPPVDRDEARFAQATKQMLLSRDPVDIRFQAEPRYKKPVGIYWLQAAAVSLTGHPGDREIWKYRLPSLVAVVIAVLLTARIGTIFGGALPGLWSGMLMAGVFLVSAEAHLATTDAALLAGIVAAQSALARLYRDARAAEFRRDRPPLLSPWEAALFWLALAATVLLKGPVGPMVVIGTLLVLSLGHRRVRWLAGLRPVPGIAAFLIVTLPWFIAITLRSGGAFWDEALGHDLMGKVVSAQESHGAPPGSYLVLMWLTYFPASVALAMAIPALWRGRRLAVLAFAAAWILPGWLVFELSPTKLIHYVLPFYPAFAVATALVWADVAKTPPRIWQWIVAGLISVLPVAGLVAICLYAMQLGSLPWQPLLAGAAALVLGAGLALTAWREAKPGAMLAGLWIMGIGFSAAAFDAVTRVPALWPAPAIVRLVPPNGACRHPPIVTDGYDEPSLVFLAPGSEHATSAEGAAKALADDACTVAVIAHRKAFLAAAADLGLHPKERDSVQGLNLGTGKKLDLTLYALY